MPYDKTTGIITAPIGIADVSAALRHHSYDLGTLCKSPNINIWSKRKPQRMAGPATTDETRKGPNGDYGFSFGDQPFNVAVGNLHAYLTPEYAKELNGWSYLRPLDYSTLAPTSNFRLLDFDNYWHNAALPMQWNGSNTAPTLRISQGKSLSITPMVATDITKTEYQLLLSDLQTFKGLTGEGYTFYFGAYVVGSDGVQKLYKLSTTPFVSESGMGTAASVTFDNVQLEVGSYTVYPFIGGIESGGTGATVRAFTVPTLKPATLVVSAAVEDYETTAKLSFAELVAGGYRATAALTITNNTASAITVTNLQCNLDGTISTRDDITIEAGDSGRWVVLGDKTYQVQMASATFTFNIGSKAYSVVATS